MNHFEWTHERVELLKSLWSDGLSVSEIAVKFGGLTRGAIIGKAHRLGLSRRKKIKLRPKAIKIAAGIPATGVRLIDLGACHCRWPLGDPRDLDAMFFCGAEPAPDRPYCTQHCIVAYHPHKERAA